MKKEGINIQGFYFRADGLGIDIDAGGDNCRYFDMEETKALFHFLDQNIEWRTEEEIEQEKADARYDENLDHLDKVRDERACSRIPDNIFRDND